MSQAYKTKTPASIQPQHTKYGFNHKTSNLRSEHTVYSAPRKHCMPSALWPYGMYLIVSDRC